MLRDQAVSSMSPSQQLPDPDSGAQESPAPATRYRKRGEGGHMMSVNQHWTAPITPSGESRGDGPRVSGTHLPRAIATLPEPAPRARKRRVPGVSDNPNSLAPAHPISAEAEGVGHGSCATPCDGADPTLPASAGGADHHRGATQDPCVSPYNPDAAPAAGEGQGSRVNQPPHTLAPIIAELREQHRQRVALQKAELRLTLQAMAICRRLCDGDKAEGAKLWRAATGKGKHPLADIGAAAILPLVEARAHIETFRKPIEKRMEKLAKHLPVWQAWAQGVRGFGAASLAAVIGETGDLSNYSNPAKVWKRMGLAVMPDGQRQRKVSGVDALEHGYSPTRRAIVWNIGECLVKVGAGGPYRALYDERKAYEIASAPDIKPIIAHKRAKRYAEKRLLRDLWRAWGGAISHLPPDGDVLIPTPLRDRSMEMAS